MEPSENQSIKKTVKTTNTVVSSVPLSKSFFTKVKYFFTLILVGGIITLGYLYYKADKELKLIKDPKAQSELVQKEVDKVIAEIAKVMVIQEDDRPIFIGTVQDPEMLKKDQEFFTNASVGDYIFVFQKTKRALLWNAEKNMIVNFGLSGEPGTSQSQTPVSEKTSTKSDSQQAE